MSEIWIFLIIFVIGFGLTKWLSDRMEQRETKLKSPFKNYEEDEKESK